MHAVIALPVGLCVLLWAAAASAQQSASEASPKTGARAEGLARAINPADYGSAVYLGAQAEILLPKTGGAGASSMMIGYDAGPLQLELSAGIAIGGDAVDDQSAPEIYDAVMRLGLPVHRGVRADFSLLAIGGVLVLDPPTGSADAIGELGAGGRFRAFLTPNVAVMASLGLIVLLRGENTSYLVGARPLGSAAVAYFFR